MTIERLVTSDFMAPSNEFNPVGTGSWSDAAVLAFMEPMRATHWLQKPRPHPPEVSQPPCNDATRPTPTNPMQRIAAVASNSNMLERWRAAPHAHATGGVVLPSFTPDARRHEPLSRQREPRYH